MDGRCLTLTDRRTDGWTDGRSYVAKTTKQLEHALAVTESTGVELRVAEVVGEGNAGKAASDREVQRVRDKASWRAAKFRQSIN